MLYVPEAQGSLPRGATHCEYVVRVPASGVPYVPRTVWWCTTGSLRSMECGHVHVSKLPALLKDESSVPMSMRRFNVRPLTAVVTLVVLFHQVHLVHSIVFPSHHLPCHYPHPRTLPPRATP